MFVLHQEVLAVSGASIFASAFLRQFWAYIRKNSLQGKVSIEWQFGPAPKNRKSTPTRTTLSG